MGRTFRLAGAMLTVALGLLPAPVRAQGAMWGRDYFPNLPVISQDGREYKFYDDLIKGKIVVVSFIFTTCPDICPLTTARLAQVQEKLGDRVGRDIFMYSISIEPEVDTPEKLKSYAEAFRAGPGWLFLTGKPADMKLIRHKLGERSRVPAEHQMMIVLGNDVTGEWGRDSAFDDIGRLATTIADMDPKLREQVRTPVKSEEEDSAHVLSERPGEAMFMKLCASCHTVGKGQRVGPDLGNVSQRRSRAWLTGYMTDPQRLRAEKDPIALSLSAQYRSVRMPSLGLAEHDASDLIAFIEAQSYGRIVEGGAGHEHHQHGEHQHKAKR